MSTAERDGFHIAQRLALLLNQAGELDVTVAYGQVDSEPSYFTSWEEGDVTYGYAVATDKDGSWTVGVLLELEEEDDD